MAVVGVVGVRAEVGSSVKGLNCGLKEELAYFNPNLGNRSLVLKNNSVIPHSLKHGSGVTLLAIPCSKIVAWDQAPHSGEEVVWGGESTALARFARRYFPLVTPLFALFPLCGAWSQATKSLTFIPVLGHVSRKSR